MAAPLERRMRRLLLRAPPGLSRLHRVPRPRVAQICIRHALAVEERGNVEEPPAGLVSAACSGRGGTGEQRAP